MTTLHRYTSLGQGDGRPQKTVAAHEQGDGRPQKSVAAHEQLWKLALQRRSACMWVTCVVLIVCFFLDSPINLSVEEKRLKIRQTSLSSPLVLQETSPPPPDSDVTKLIDFSVGGCNIWKGEWIPNPDGPAYTNASCPYIQGTQNCIKNGRPDLDFLYWRWKPRGCKLPLFNAKAFFKRVRGKKWAFIGDSLARNHYQSVICYLAQVEVPEMTYNDGLDGNIHWYFRSYNFTLAVVWAPFLIKGTEDAADGFPKGAAKLHLDVMDESWAPSLHNYDYVVLSGGRWYFRTSVYFEQKKVVGCFYCSKLKNITDVGFGYAYRAALRTVFDYLISSEYKGVVFFRTISPEHWQNGAWDQGGNCKQTAPVKSKTATLEGPTLEMYNMQLEEFGKTVQRSSEYSFTLKIMDTLHASLLRPDAHPGPYGHLHHQMQNDCVHWCLPGAVDTWSAMLLYMLKHL